MKRLLVYLFIVMSLGINVDVKALYVSDFDEMVEEFKSYPPAADFYVYAIDENEYFTGYLNLLSKKKSYGNIYSSKGYICGATSKIKSSNKQERKYSGTVVLKCNNNIKFKGTWKQVGIKGWGKVKNLY